MTDATAPAKKIEWRATRQTGIGHGFTGKGPALCGEPNQPEKFDWPRRDRCVACDEKARAL